MTRSALVLCIALAACSGKAPVDDSFSDLAGADEKSDKFTGRMTIVGDIKYGVTKSFLHTASPSNKKWSTLKFLGNKGDQLAIDVKSSHGDTVAWLVDKSMEILAFDDDSGDGTNSRIKHTLADGANTTFFIVVREYNHRSMKVSVTLNGKPAAVGDFTSPCTVDADCALVRPDCCSLQAHIAVRAGQEDAYRASLNCPQPLFCPAVLPVQDHNMAQCQSNKCVTVKVEDISCGGHTINPHTCPAGFGCVGEGLAYDAPGKCEEQCGGFAGFRCADSTDICIDSPFDGCDPENGGADCGGICRDSICSGQTARCAAGYVWSKYHCNCVENPCNVIDCAPLYHCEPINDGTSGQCVKDQVTTDCRTTGCGSGRWCSYCWGSFQCIPDGALC